MLNGGLLIDVKKMAMTLLVPCCGTFVGVILCEVWCLVLISVGMILCEV